MGHTRHHGMFVTTFLESLAQEAHASATTIFGDLVSPLQESRINAFYSFAVFPDGSNEGWEDSNKGDENRAMFKRWLESKRYEDGSTALDWVEVQYGDDNGETLIIADSDDTPLIVDAEEGTAS